MRELLFDSARLSQLLSITCIALLIGCGGTDSPASNSDSEASGSAVPFASPPSVEATPTTARPPASATPAATPILALAGALASLDPLPALVPPDSPEHHRAGELLAGEPGVYGFVVLDADGTVVASHNSRTPFIAASLYKLILMADIFHRIERGEFTEDATIVLDEHTFDDDGDMYFSFEDLGMAFPLEEYLYAVGAYSSNAAARTLMTLTTPETLRATALAIGMEQTYLFTDPTQLPFWPPAEAPDASPDDVALARLYLELSAEEGPVNVTTPLDMARYQLALANGTLISPWVSAQIAAILEDQLIRDRIPFYLGEEIRVLNKPGNLEDAVNDVGVIYLPQGPRAVAVLAQAVPDTDRATMIEQRLALIASGATEIPPMPDEAVEHADE